MPELLTRFSTAVEHHLRIWPRVILQWTVLSLAGRSISTMEQWWECNKLSNRTRQPAIRKGLDGKLELTPPDNINQQRPLTKMSYIQLTLRMVAWPFASRHPGVRSNLCLIDARQSTADGNKHNGAWFITTRGLSVNLRSGRENR